MTPGCVVRCAQVDVISLGWAAGCHSIELKNVELKMLSSTFVIAEVLFGHQQQQLVGDFIKKINGKRSFL